MVSWSESLLPSSFPLEKWPLIFPTSLLPVDGMNNVDGEGEHGVIIFGRKRKFHGSYLGTFNTLEGNHLVYIFGPHQIILFG